MTDPIVERVYMEDESSHRWHIAMLVDDSEPLLPDACNVQGARDYYHELPEDIDPELLCQRCFG
jgi:hypothetical protein